MLWENIKSNFRVCACVIMELSLSLFFFPFQFKESIVLCLPRKLINVPCIFSICKETFLIYYLFFLRSVFGSRKILDAVVVVLVSNSSETPACFCKYLFLSFFLRVLAPSVFSWSLWLIMREWTRFLSMHNYYNIIPVKYVHNSSSSSFVRGIH